MRKLILAFNKLTCSSFTFLQILRLINKQLAALVEKELIEECRKGDLHNFRKVVEKSTPLIFSVAFRMLGDEDSARDIVQETLVTIWQKMSKIKTAESYKTWVYRIAVNKCYDELRKQKRQNESRYDDQAWALISNHLSDDGITELESQENAMIINILTNKLSHKQKAVFVLSELEEMPAGEISEITGMTKAVVKANLYYARKNIESLLQKYLKR
ncbi:MAG TPA: hypothetical protein DCZ51_13850 [Bacteroidales bacterium]|nr:hypothetical protein [Bacteroidales bacterium]